MIAALLVTIKQRCALFFFYISGGCPIIRRGDSIEWFSLFPFTKREGSSERAVKQEG
jgi:hypothetical protein